MWTRCAILIIFYFEREHSKMVKCSTATLAEDHIHSSKVLARYDIKIHQIVKLCRMVHEAGKLVKRTHFTFCFVGDPRHGTRNVWYVQRWEASTSYPVRACLRRKWLRRCDTTRCNTSLWGWTREYCTQRWIVRWEWIKIYKRKWIWWECLTLISLCNITIVKLW